uniref:Uncharacterized protein n=1 Tax=Helianthus annuus TaxID=4232 RepID=A0A251T4Z6_HELAN
MGFCGGPQICGGSSDLWRWGSVVSSLSPSDSSLILCHRQMRTSSSKPWWCRTAGNEAGTRLGS